MIRTCMCHNYDYISNTNTELGKVNKASLCTTKHAMSVLVFVLSLAMGFIMKSAAVQKVLPYKTNLFGAIFVFFPTALKKFIIFCAKT